MPDGRAFSLASDIRLRRAEPADAAFLVELGQDPEVEPFLAGGRAQSAEEIVSEVEQSQAEPGASGRFLIEARGADGEWQAAGAIAFTRTNRRSRIAWVGGLAVLPTWRGRGVGVAATRMLARLLFEDLAFHRAEAEVYAFNERGVRVAERAGFAREGRKRRAYWRHDEWQDSVLLGLVADELEPQVEPGAS
jgi:RimJ/RimL family protein N-acetyltransferase